jgi:uncharacterized protein YkuJ
MDILIKRFILILTLILTLTAARGQVSDTLSVHFKNPPDYTKPWVYWYWISDHISREGITKDLEAMARVGIGEALIGNIDEIKQKGTVKALTETWYQMMDHALREGKRLGVNIGLFNGPGWSQSGGPWNQPGQSMRYLTMSELKVKGPQTIEVKLDQPTPQFQDVAVIAYALPGEDADALTPANCDINTIPEIEGWQDWFDGQEETGVLLTPSNDHTFTIEFSPIKPHTVRSLVLSPTHTAFRADCELQGLQGDGTFRTIKSFRIERTNNSTSVGFLPFAPICETFDGFTSSHFRLIFRNMGGQAGFTGIALSGAARTERYVEKQLGKLWPTSSPQWDAYLWNQPVEVDHDDLLVDPKNVLNISAAMQPDGTLEWAVPPGEWVIQRIGMTPTGQKNAPASVEATGLEVDKMNRQWVGDHFDAYIGKIISRLPEDERSALKRIVADSYETGAQNWTDGLSLDFKKQFGYDPLPYLPVIFGRVVGSADQSERFLWDLRRLVADRISYHYVGGLRDKAHENGLLLWLENYGHWGFPGEFLQYGGQSDDIAGEFWTSDEPEGMELRAAASAAHTYGKNIVHAEAFTSGGPMWQFDPRGLKKRGDWSATKGINHFVMHVYIHQPYETQIPGINAWFGVEFNRHNTWFFQSKAWIDYIRRTHYLLQEGKYVADVAYFIGEDAPKMTGIRDPELPEGYNFDYINAEVIENSLTVKDGRFVLPDGMTYRVLVLPPQSTMRPGLLRKVKALIEAGGVVVGPPPTHSPSLENYPVCDQEVEQLAKAIWDSCDGISVKKARLGKGMVYHGSTLSEVFSDLQLDADIGNLDVTRFPWIHRSESGIDIYYISNQTDEQALISPAFRVEGLQPELWDPVTGERRDLPDFKTVAGKTMVPLEFAPHQSYFIVFRRKAIAPPKNPVNFVRNQTIGILDGAWTVSFDKKWGLPDSVVFKKLEDWTLRPETAIRHYSGTARYHQVFDAPKVNRESSMYLNLGSFSGMAEVTINGRQVGLVWAEPHILDISGFLKPRNNVMEIAVTNTWHNRLTGDAGLPAQERRTSATTSPDAHAPLMPSGLTGPVLLQIPDPKPYAQKTVITADPSTFSKPGKALITIHCPTEGVKIFYTTDGTKPTEKSNLYTRPFEVHDYALISAMASGKGLQSSEISTLEIEAYDPAVNGWHYQYAEGSFSKLPDFSMITPAQTGTTTTLDLARLKFREDHFALTFRALLTVPETGDYTFWLLSDDGSRLTIDGKTIIDNDGFHGEVEIMGRVSLTKGEHVIQVDYFENINAEALKLRYSFNQSKPKELPVRWLTFDLPQISD